MRRLPLKKSLAMLLSILLVMTLMPMSFSAEVPTNDLGIVEVSGEKVTLSLSFVKTYYNSQSKTPYEDINDFRGKSLELANTALEEYNSANSTSLTLADVDALKVTTTDDAYLCGQFEVFIKEKLSQIEEIDMSGANVTTRKLSWETDYTDNALPDQYFGIYSGTVKLPNIKKIILPDSLEIIKNYCFKNLSTLEIIEFGNNLKSIGAEAFQNCSSLKALHFPDSLNTFTSDATYCRTGCTALTEVSYHGDAEGSTDKSAFYTELFDIIKANTVTKVDLSGSGVDTSTALRIANKTGLTYLDIRNCANIDYSSTDGEVLYSRIKVLINNGSVVKFTGIPELDIFVNNGNTAQIVVSDELVELVLYNASHYGKDEFKNITDNAISNYNMNHSESQIAFTDIKKVTVSSAEDKYVLSSFRGFLNSYVPQVEEVDMSKANVLNAPYYSEATYPLETHAHVLTDQYFGIYGNNIDGTLNCLKKVVLPENLKKMGNYIFMNCHALEEVVLPKALETTGANTFAYCENLETLTVTKGTFKEYTFQNAAVKNIIFVGGNSDVFELSKKEGNSILNATVYCADASVYENCIGANLKTKVAKVVYVGNMADVTVKTNETVNGYFLPVSATKTFRGWKTISDTEVEAIWFVSSEVKGDANNDGKVDILDLVHLKKFLINAIDEIANDTSYIDLEGDGINSKELIIMRRALFGVESHEEYFIKINSVA